MLMPTTPLLLTSLLATGLAWTATGSSSVAPAAQGVPTLAAPSVQTAPPVQTGESLVSTDLVALDPAILPGATFALGIRFKVAPDWHVYWKNPGDSGGPPGIVVSAPKGFTVGPIEYPRPSIIEHPGEVTIGYEREVIYRILLTAPASFEGLPERITIGAKLDWMVCSNRCLMGRRDVKVEFPLNGPIPSELTAKPGEFPQPAKDLGVTATIESSAQGQTLVVTAPALEKGSVLRFIPDTTPGVSYGATAPAPITVAATGGELRIPLTVKPQNALGEALRAAGLVTIDAPGGTPRGSAEIEVAIATPPSGAKPASP